MAGLGIIVFLAGIGCLVIGAVLSTGESRWLAEANRLSKVGYHTDYSPTRWTRSSSPTPPPHRDLRYQTSPPEETGWNEPADGKPGDFAQAEVGQSISYQHPQQGALQSPIIGTIKYVELWQKQKAPSEPWVPTGNTFTAHWLNNEMLLYTWKGQLFVLDQYHTTSDSEIKRTFLEPAHRFGESEETADVSFAYPPGSWKITDIGKFRIKVSRGEGLRLWSGALGRFIHAAGGTDLENRVLVVEDYQEGGGGLDTVWQGWQLSWDDLLKIE